MHHEPSCSLLDGFIRGAFECVFARIPCFLKKYRRQLSHELRWLAFIGNLAASNCGLCRSPEAELALRRDLQPQ